MALERRYPRTQILRAAGVLTLAATVIALWPVFLVMVLGGQWESKQLAFVGLLALVHCLVFVAALERVTRSTSQTRPARQLSLLVRWVPPLAIGPVMAGSLEELSTLMLLAVLMFVVSAPSSIAVRYALRRLLPSEVSEPAVPWLSPWFHRLGRKRVIVLLAVLCAWPIVTALLFDVATACTAVVDCTSDGSCHYGTPWRFYSVRGRGGAEVDRAALVKDVVLFAAFVPVLVAAVLVPRVRVFASISVFLFAATMGVVIVTDCESFAASVWHGDGSRILVEVLQGQDSAPARRSRAGPAGN